MAYAQSGPYPGQQPQAPPTHYYEQEYYQEPGQQQQLQRQPMQRPPPQHQCPSQGQRPRPPPVRNYGNGPPLPQGMNSGPRGGYGGPNGGSPGPGRGGPPPNPQKMGNGRPPPPHMQNGPRHGPGIEEGMINMKINDGRNYNGGPPPQQRQRPPPNGRPPPSQGHPDDMYGNPPPQQRPPPPNGNFPPRGPPQRVASHGDFRGGGPPPQGFQRQGPPPPVRNYGGVQQDGWGGEQYDGYQDGGKQYGNGNGNGSGRMPPPERMRTPGNPAPQRSMTMPVRGNDYMSPPPPMANHQQPRVLSQHDQNGLSGPRGYGSQPPPIMEHNVPPAGYNHQGGHYDMPGAILPEHYEYQVNDVLDSYYDGREQQYDGQAEYHHQTPPQHYQGPRRGSAGVIPPSTSSGPAGNQLEGFDPLWESPQPNSNTVFVAQAYRTRSQPDLRHSEHSGYSQNGQAAPVEMEGDIPPLSTSPRSGMFPAQGELPPVLRVKTPAPSQRPGPPGPPQPMPPNRMEHFTPPPNGHMQQSGGSQYTPPPNGQQYPPPNGQQYPPQQYPPQNAQQYPPQNGYPPRMQAVDALPYHPSPPQSNRSSNPDALPEHPTPVRPGLMQDQNPPMGQGQGGPPPPVRQYAPRDSVDNRTQQAPPPKGHLTLQELSKAVQLARSAPNDQPLQLALAKKYIEAADVLADEGGRADIKTARKNRENYIFDAHKIIKKLANGSHPYPEAMFFLAQCHGDGALGLQVDRERAFSLYHSAAKLNHAPSAYRTAVCCEIGAGTKKDPIKSVQWYKKAASLGDTGAMYKLGIILLKGLLGQQKSTRDALSWLKRAADHADAENPHALHELGLLYERADGRDQSIIPDLSYALELFTKAAELGYAPSQFRLGHAYEFGVMGCPIDPRKSILWYSRAAVKGEPDSELALSGWYLTGAEGVLEQSDTEAYLWARRAAEKGLPKAEYAVGHLTEAGFGVTPNMEEAKRWYYKAASQGFPKAQERLRDLKKGGTAGQQKQRERLSRSNVKKDDDCTIM
ncbi:hypothetical protein BGX38DRAFT_521280 [Terfezia claveryi]|nr:hypothetical protein BGX38DRAFT_521280 [Terfezia claveryi]